MCGGFGIHSVLLKSRGAERAQGKQDKPTRKKRKATTQPQVPYDTLGRNALKFSI
jgi:hypothetical protein